MEIKPGVSVAIHADGGCCLLLAYMHLFLMRLRPLCRFAPVPGLKQLAEVVEICETLGYQGFRARIAHDQQRHVNARETLEYVAKGKHLAFICDSW